MAGVSRLAVGIADVRTGGPGEVLAAVGLGSCVAVAIRDRSRRRGSLAHIMLPQQSDGRRRSGENMRKYADVAVPEAVRALEHIGCRRSDLEAKIAGGANIFDLGRGAEGADIGSRNVEAVIRALEEQGIPLLASDVGGREGRTVEFSVDSGDLLVKTVRGARRTL
jgi:chemotaxis protein CheD